VAGVVLDIASGEGRLGELLGPDVGWIGIDDSPAQLAECERRPLVRADMRALPFRSGCADAAAHLWCLYHLDEPVAAVVEARRVLRPGGRYFAATSARANDPELLPEGYPPSTFDAEEAATVVGAVFDDVTEQWWDDRFYALETRDDLVAYCRHCGVDPERADSVPLPLWLTKRGVLVRATA
jgi:SAM-dependent methyltransferase